MRYSVTNHAWRVFPSFRRGWSCSSILVLARHQSRPERDSDGGAPPTRTSPHSTSSVGGGGGEGDGDGVPQFSASAAAAPRLLRPSRPHHRARGDYSRRSLLAVEGGRDNQHVGPSSVAGRPTGVAADAATFLCYYAMCQTTPPSLSVRSIATINYYHRGIASNLGWMNAHT